MKIENVFMLKMLVDDRDKIQKGDDIEKCGVKCIFFCFGFFFIIVLDF